MPVINGLGVIGHENAALELTGRKRLEVLQGPLVPELAQVAIRAAKDQVGDGEWGGSLIRVYKMEAHPNLEGVQGLWLHSGQVSDNSWIGVYHVEYGWMQIGHDGTLQALTLTSLTDLLEQARTQAGSGNFENDVNYRHVDLRQLRTTQFPKITWLWYITEPANTGA